MPKPVVSLISLAFSMHATKGAYALLVGSGVSSGAGILTGWGITENLIRRVAKMEGDDCEPDPWVWYKKKYEEEADYSRLIKMLGHSPSDRKQILRSYFEPTPEEVEQQVKVPGRAHRAIAKMVNSGHVRVILTTNFDRLIQRAITDEGVTPIVISTPDGIQGALPLNHSNCTVFKLHGDYDDTRLRNTQAELDKYPKQVNDLLNEIFDRYGLVVCGWSGDWDRALRAALQRCKSRRFTTFWTYRGKPSETTAPLAKHREADLIDIRDADHFFDRLSESVLSLEELGATHPMDVRTAVATVKRYLAEERHRIRLRDLVEEECKSVVRQVESEVAVSGGAPVETGSVQRQLARYEAMVERLLQMVMAGCHFGEDYQQSNWVLAIECLMNLEKENGGTWERLQAYPGFLLLYAASLAALSAERYGTLAAVMTKPTIHRTYETFPVARTDFMEVVNSAAPSESPTGQYKFPGSEYLYTLLREPLREYIPNDNAYDKTFDRFEYLLSLVHAHYWQRQQMEKNPDGSFVRFIGVQGRYIYRSSYETANVFAIFNKEIQRDGEAWPPLKAGLFDGSLKRLKEVKVGSDDELRKFAWH